MSCRGTCMRHVVGRPASGPVYDGGRCRCQTCGVWMSAAAAVTSNGTASVETDAVGNRCPCCGQRVRFEKRGKRGRRIRRQAEAVPAVAAAVVDSGERAEAQITVRPFYDSRRNNRAGMSNFNDNEDDDDSGIMQPVEAAAGRRAGMERVAGNAAKWGRGGMSALVRAES